MCNFACICVCVCIDGVLCYSVGGCGVGWEPSDNQALPLLKCVSENFCSVGRWVKLAFSLFVILAKQSSQQYINATQDFCESSNYRNKNEVVWCGAEKDKDTQGLACIRCDIRLLVELSILPAEFPTIKLQMYILVIYNKLLIFLCFVGAG